MPSYLLYSENVETIAPDEHETQSKIIETMKDGMMKVRENAGTSVRISHAKSYAVLKGSLIVRADLPTELAQGLFAQPGSHPVLVRMASAPGEFNDDSKLNTVRGMALKIFGVPGPKLPGHTADTQDFVLDNGKEFIAGGPKEFLQAFKPNAEIAPKLSDSVKGAVSTVARVTNAALNAVGANSEKLDFYGHEQIHPMLDSFYSQTAIRYGDYVAKLGVVQDTPGLGELKYDPETPDALRDAANAFFRTHAAEYSVQIQLNTGLDDMPVEQAQAKWSEDLSQYQEIARLVLPVQTAWDPEKDEFVEPLSFAPAHSLAAHRPLGGINRARLVAYHTLADLRRQQNGAPTQEISSAQSLPA